MMELKDLPRGNIVAKAQDAAGQIPDCAALLQGEEQGISPALLQQRGRG